MLPSCFVVVVSACLLVLGVGPVSGQDSLSKPIRIFAGSAGGGSNFVSRELAQGISGPLKQPVIVDNRVSILGQEAVSKAPPDGSNLLVAGNSFWVFPLLHRAAYDVVSDFSPISLLAREVGVLVVHPSVPAKSVKDLIALAKARPGVLNYASSGLGGSTHLSAELFKSVAGVNIVHVPYKGNASAIPALVAGEVQLYFASMGSVASYIKSGRVRVLAVTNTQPSVLFPELPTIAASGLPAYGYVSVNGIWASAKTPAAIINRLSQEIVRVLNLPEIKEKFSNFGLEADGSSVEEFADFIKSDMAKMAKVIKDAGIKTD